jgi:hypothetical protein
MSDKAKGDFQRVIINIEVKKHESAEYETGLLRLSDSASFSRKIGCHKTVGSPARAVLLLVSSTELRGIMSTLRNQPKNRKFTPAAFWQNSAAAREMTQTLLTQIDL